MPHVSRDEPLPEFSDDLKLKARHFLQPLEAKLYSNIAEDRKWEHKSSIFWQILLQRHYPLEEDYGVVCEVASNDQATNTSVLKHDRDAGYIAAMVHLEAKKPGGSALAVESQVKSAAKRILDEHNLDCIYMMATVGLYFKFWQVLAKDEKMHCIELSSKYDAEAGTVLTNDRGYVHFDAAGYRVFEHCVAYGKKYLPFVVEPVLRSKRQRSVSPSEPSSTESEALLSKHSQHSSRRESSLSGCGTHRAAKRRSSSRATHVRFSEPDLQQPPPKQENSENIPLYRVRAMKELTKDGGYQIVFEDRNGYLRETKPEHWVKVFYGSHHVYEYESSKTTYWCKRFKKCVDLA